MVGGVTGSVDDVPLITDKLPKTSKTTLSVLGK